MADNIFRDNFFDRAQRPWHSLGTWATEEQLSATEAFDKYTPVVISLEPMVVQYPGGTLPSDAQAVIRWPTKGEIEEQGADSVRPVQLATVGPNYTLIEPRAICEIVDTHIDKYVETIGLLNTGTLFLTFLMDSFSVGGKGGDEVVRYLSVAAPCDGTSAYEVFVSNTRIVCENTLMVGLYGAKQRYSIKHDSNAHALLEGWLAHAWGRAEKAGVNITKEFNAMAKVKADESLAAQLFANIFTYPNEPEWVPVPELRERAEARYEYVKGYADDKRAKAMAIFADGAGFEHVVNGYESKTSGTVWSVYNAASEVIEYDRNRGRNAAASTWFGGRRRDMERAFDVCHEAIKA